MKVLRILLLVFLIIIIVVIGGGYYFLAHLDLNKYKPQITSRVQSALRRSFDYQQANLNVSMRDGLYVKLHGVSLGDDQRFSNEPFILIKDLDLQIDLLDIIFKRTLSVSHLTVSSPTFNIIRNANGELNAQSLGGSPIEPPAAPKQNFSSGQTKASPKEIKKAALPAIFIKDITLQNGVVHFIDQNTSLPLNISLTQTNLYAKDFSLDKPFSFELETAVFGTEPNVSISGQVQLDLNNNGVSLSRFRTALNFNKISLEQMKKEVPLSLPLPWPDKIGGKWEVVFHSLKIAPQGILEIDAGLNIKEASLLVKNVSGYDIDLPFIDLSVEHFNFKTPFDVKLALGYMSPKPNISFDGKVFYEPATTTVQITQANFLTKLEDLPWEEIKIKLPIPKEIPWPNVLKGALKISVKKMTANSKGLQELLTDLSLEQAAVSFAEVAPGISLDVPQLSVRVMDVALGKEFAFEIKAAYLSDVPNVDIKGNFEFNPTTQGYLLRATEINTDLDSVSLDKLRSSIKTLEKSPLPSEVKGQLQIVIGAFRGSNKGISEVSMKSSLDKGRVGLKELNVPLEPVTFNLSWANNTLNLENLKAFAGQGNIQGDLKATALFQSPDFSGHLVLKDLKAQEVLNQSELPVKIEGLLNGTINFLGQGIAPEVLIQNLKAQSEMTITEGKLIDINVLKMALDQLTMVPNLQERIQEKLPEKYKDILTQKDTMIESLNLKANLEESRVQIPLFNLKADSFLIEAFGALSLDQSFALNGSFIIPEDLTSVFIQSVPELRYILDQQNQIRFPVSITGKGTNFKVVPDLEYLTKRIVVNKGKEELKKVINKYINVGPAEDNGQQAPPEGQAPQESPQEQIIGDILNTIFK